MKINRLVYFLYSLFWGVLLLPAFAVGLLSPTSATAENNTPPPPGIDYHESLTKRIELERADTSELKGRLAQLQAAQDAIKSEITSYRLQITEHGNLLLSLGADINQLEKAAALNRTTLNQVQGRLREITQQLDTITQAGLKNEEQHALNKEQLNQIKSQRQSVPDADTLIKKIGSLVQLFSEKQKILEGLAERYTKQKEALEDIQTRVTAQSAEFETKIKNRKKQLLFQRSDSPLRITQWLQVSVEIQQVWRKISQVIALPFWREELNSIWELEGLQLFTLSLLFIIMMIMFSRIRRYTRSVADRPFLSRHPWRLLGFSVLTDALPLLGIIVFMSIFTSIRNVDSASLLFPVQSILIIILFTRWCHIALAKTGTMVPPFMPAPYAIRVNSLMTTVRWFAVLYVISDWMIEGTSFTLFILRVFFELRLILWGLSVKKQIEKTGLSLGDGKTIGAQPLRAPLTFLGYIVFGLGPLFELAGFGEFAWYWYRSWGNTAIVFLWAAIVFLILREWDQPFDAAYDQTVSHATAKAQPVRWVLFRLCWLVWAVLLILGVLFAWGARQQVIGGLVQALGYPIEIGQMQLSIMGFIYAFLLLFFTRILAKTFRYLLKEKLLIKSGLERGIQESITNLTMYVVWGMGILIALHAVGFNTAALAVVLGAMGIGLGFGLQNIFSNFISGIILLFERPIQAGDDIEINGLWATVQKINVRATVVQTYDNASIIIPNSEFISSQVTNWSFKDRRLRRKITIGVAYGSDTLLVRDTLLEIAANTPKVLKRPAPDVVFSDFGDSALIFMLRFWTTLDGFLATESEIRYEIDRVFNEKQINIAFPQRDIHVYNMDAPPAPGALPVKAD